MKKSAPKELFLFAERIKSLRMQAGMTQAELARYLSLSRSSINSWEMGFSVPSATYIVELAKMFSVSADYLLGIERSSVISAYDLSEKEVSMIVDMANHFRELKYKKE